MTRKNFIIGTWVTALVFAGLCYLAYRIFMARVPEVYRSSTFTHPEYGFTVSVPPGMKAGFARHTTSKPPYDSLGVYYPSTTFCPANADCMSPRDVRLYVWKIDGTQSFAELLTDDNGYGAYLRDFQASDTSKYSSHNGWVFYRGPNATSEEVRFAYSAPLRVLVRFENTSLRPEMESIIRSLR